MLLALSPECRPARIRPRERGTIASYRSRQGGRGGGRVMLLARKTLILWFVLFACAFAAALATSEAALAETGGVISAQAGIGGTITPSGDVAVELGFDQTFTIEPSTGYHIADVVVDGGSVGAVTSHTFTNVTADHTIAASFAINTYAITVTPGAHGSITPGTDDVALRQLADVHHHARHRLPHRHADRRRSLPGATGLLDVPRRRLSPLARCHLRDRHLRDHRDARRQRHDHARHRRRRLRQLADLHHHARHRLPRRRRARGRQLRRRRDLPHLQQRDRRATPSAPASRSTLTR